MACGKFVVGLAVVAIIALCFTQEAAAGNLPLGASCVGRSECDSSKCMQGQDICCDNLSFANSGQQDPNSLDPKPKLAVTSPGKCTCCKGSRCQAGFGAGSASTSHTSAKGQVYTQTC